MPFDLNEDRRLKTCWFNYEKSIKELNRRKYYIVKNMLANKEVSCLEEAENEIKKNLKTLEDERRKEMKKIQKEVRAEKKIEKDLEQAPNGTTQREVKRKARSFTCEARTEQS